MGSGFSKMKKQAKLMEQQFESLRQERQKTLFTGSSGHGLVTITLNGEKEIQSLTIKPECVDPNDTEGLQDLIQAAHAEACSKIESSDMSPPGFGG